MLKVLLVDDERNIIEMLKALVDWNAYGFEVCGEAGNGEEAWVRIAESDPDLVIADINMPFSSGLDLAERLKRAKSRALVVMLTGYSDFNYARMAVNTGVFYYMLKPVNADELVRVLQTASREIASAADADRGARELREKAALGGHVLRDRFLRDLVSGKIHLPEAELRAQLGEVGISFPGDRFTVVVVETDRLAERFPGEGEKRFAVENVMETLRRSFEIPGTFVVFPDAAYRAVVIACERMESERRVSCYSIACEKVRMELFELKDLPVSIGYGSVYSGCENLHESWSEAMSALRYKFILGSSRVIAFNSIELSDSRELFCSEKTRTSILSSLRAGDRTALETTVYALLDPQQVRRSSPDYVQLICAELVLLGVSFLNENALSVRDVLGEDAHPLDEIMMVETLKEAKSWVLRFYASCVARQSENSVPASRRLVDRAVKLIGMRFSDSELCVMSISRELHVNEDYLSSTFKKEYGIPLVKFLTRFRLEKARDLMNEGLVNLAYIAERVGYEDPNYFGKCFKKHFGVAPSKFIE